MVRHTSSSSWSTSWADHKIAAKDYFERGNYEEALSRYRAALNPEYNCPPSERQIILSNIVACRLKIGGPAQARAAVEDAKQCIALNEQWAKSHIRLASAYISLGGHSNDACNALQRALVLDPGNMTARQMLTRELRRDRVTTPPTQPSAPPQDHDDTPSVPIHDHPRTTTDNRQPPPPQQQQHHEQRANRDTHDDNMNIDDSLPILERIKLFYMRAVAWYSSQGDDIQTFCKVAFAILLLYVAFGGRFGLSGLFSSSGDEARYARKYESSGRVGGRGNYEPGNAYDRFYRPESPTQRRNANAGSNYYESPRASKIYEHEYRRKKATTTTNNRGTSFSVLDGSVLSMILLLGISFVCYQMGINPIHVMVLMNAFTLNRGGGFRRMHGMGYGMPRPWWGGGHRPAGFARPRNGWF